MVPLQRPDGLVAVDPAWGEVQPIQLAPGVRTIGELELIDHIERGGEIVDTRVPNFFETPTIPGARRIPHTEVARRAGELARPTVLFCNGPQCKATPGAVRELLAAGHPAEAILYYRGGIHDWMTLGYPTET